MSHWWVPVGLGLLAGAGLFLMVEQALRAPFHARRFRTCSYHVPIGWYCMRARGHGGPCLPMRSWFGVLMDVLRRKVRTPLLRWRKSHDRCPYCGKREAPNDDYARGCNCPF